jgi:hypothetical protein
MQANDAEALHRETTVGTSLEGHRGLAGRVINASQGITTDLDERLRAHDAGGSPHTSKYRPWKLVMHLCFQDEQRAVEFERYLKSGSGHAFAKKRFW